MGSLSTCSFRSVSTSGLTLSIVTTRELFRSCSRAESDARGSITICTPRAATATRDAGRAATGRPVASVPGEREDAQSPTTDRSRAPLATAARVGILAGNVTVRPEVAVVTEMPPRPPKSKMAPRRPRVRDAFDETRHQMIIPRFIIAPTINFNSTMRWAMAAPGRRQIDNGEQPKLKSDGAPRAGRIRLRLRWSQQAATMARTLQLRAPLAPRRAAPCGCRGCSLARAAARPCGGCW